MRRLLEDPDGIDDAQRSERRAFIMALQQFTSPVMAKGLEDTAFYRHFPLSSLNEVGGDPRQFGIPLAAFHTRNLQRLGAFPHAVLATSTHDSKRSEDVRARINVLSEIPGEWDRAIRSWRALNRERKTNFAGAEVPSAAEEYLIYQTLVGVWPLHPPDPREREELTSRIEAFMRKAMREAKLHSSWINPNQPYEEAVDRFIRASLEPSPENVFLREFTAFVHRIQPAGMWNSLSQTLLKIASPGVPDFYQGSEIWDFTLVDPDNRRPVDYSLRRRMMSELRSTETSDPVNLIERLTTDPTDGAIKLYLISRALCFRKSNRDLLTNGTYIPLRASGARQKHVIAFARLLGRHAVVAVAGRFFMRLGAESATPVGETTWGNSTLPLRRDLARAAYRDVFSGCTIETKRNGKCALPLARVLAHLPVALLDSVDS